MTKTGPVRLFVADIDGCLAEPYRPFDLDGFRALARHAASEAPEHPALSLCTGRPYSYAEAVAQALGLRVPIAFESGGGIFDPARAEITWNPRFTGEVVDEMETLRRWILEACVAGSRMNFDYGKRTQAGLVCGEAAEVARFVPEVEAYVRAHHPRFRVFHTEVSIDVAVGGITKLEAIGTLAERAGVTLAQTAYIGDSNGDLEALQAVGYSFAPANATEEVRAVVGAVTEGRVMAGTLEAYRWCVHQNRTA